MKKSIIDQLIAERETVSSDALKEALVQHEQRKSKEQTERILQNLDCINNAINEAVDNLRKARKLEKEAKRQLTVVNNAYEAFKTNADFNEFIDTLVKKNVLLESVMPF